MKNVGLIIFDEGHLFDDLHRGMQYELLVSLIKNQLGEYVQTILISPFVIHFLSHFISHTHFYIR